MVLGVFDKCYLINLADQPERLVNSVKELNGIGIDPIIYSVTKPEDHGGFRTPGQHGCWRSHRQVVQMAKDERLQSVLIVEDDVIFHPKFLAKWAIISPKFPDYWDLFYFHTHHSKNLPNDWPTTLVRTKGELLNHFYAVHSQFYDLFLKITEPIGTPIDEQLSSNGWQLTVYGLHPALAGQRAGLSTINDAWTPAKYILPDRLSKLGMERIRAERHRQMVEEHYMSNMDDRYTDGQLAKAAGCYELHLPGSSVPPGWPWPSYFWKPTTRIRMLEKAGALYMAESERLERMIRASGQQYIGDDHHDRLNHIRASTERVAALLEAELV